MRGLGRPDAFPAGDLAVVKYLAQQLLGRDDVASEQEMREFSRRWSPHRALALVYAYAEMQRRSELESKSPKSSPRRKPRSVARTTRRGPTA